MTSRTSYAALVLIGGLIVVCMPLISADEVPEVAAAAPVAEPDAVPAPSDDSIMSLIMDSGITGLLFMGALGLFSLVGVTVAIERLFHTRRDRIVPDEFVRQVKQVVANEGSTPADLKVVCADHDSPAAAILDAGIQRSGRPMPEVEKAMEDAAAREMASLRSRVRPLTVAGNVAPLIGLLGTVVGMIIAFKTASQAGLGKGEMLAQGIYMALITTAAGLSIAIPSLLCAAYFNGKIEGFFRDIDEALLETFPCFARVEERGRNWSQSTDSPSGDHEKDKLMSVT